MVALLQAQCWLRCMRQLIWAWGRKNTRQPFPSLVVATTPPDPGRQGNKEVSCLKEAKQPNDFYFTLPFTFPNGGFCFLELAPLGSALRTAITKRRLLECTDSLIQQNLWGIDKLSLMLSTLLRIKKLTLQSLTGWKGSRISIAKSISSFHIGRHYISWSREAIGSFSFFLLLIFQWVMVWGCSPYVLC